MKKFERGIMMDGRRVSGRFDCNYFADRFLQVENGNEFKKSSFPGVETKQLDIDLVPSEIMTEILNRGGRVVSFFMIRTNGPIPIHLHEKEGEAYFGGDGSGTTEIISDELSARIKMGPEIFSIVDPGWSHGLHLEKGSKGMTFFGAKFKISTPNEEEPCPK